MFLGNSSLLQERFNSHLFMCGCLKMQRALGEFVSLAGEVYFPCVYVCLSKNAACSWGIRLSCRRGLIPMCLRMFVKKCIVFLGNSSLLRERFNSHVFMCACLKMQRALGEFVSPAGEV